MCPCSYWRYLVVLFLWCLAVLHLSLGLVILHERMDAPTANRIQDAYVHRTDEPIHMVLLWWGIIDTGINVVSDFTDGDGCIHFHVGRYRWDIHVYRNIYGGDQAMKIPRFSVIISSYN